MKSIVILIVLFFSCNMNSFAGAVSFTFDEGAYNSVSQPRLKYPINDAVILSGNDPLEFKWWNDIEGIHGFTFKIYKGYNMYAVNLIHKENLSSSASSVKIDSALFKDGEVYTWTLIQINSSGYKSDKSFNSFKVTKK